MNFYSKILEIFGLFLFYNVYKEKMFTLKVEVGHEAPWQPSISKMQLQSRKYILIFSFLEFTKELIILFWHMFIQIKLRNRKMTFILNF